MPISSPKPASASSTERSGHGRRRGAVGVGGPPPDCPCTGLARGTGARDLPCHRGAFGGREDMSVQIVWPWPPGNSAAGQNRLDPRRVHRRPLQAPIPPGSVPAGRHKAGKAGGGRDARGRRRRCLLLPPQQGSGQRHGDMHRPLRHPKRLYRRRRVYTNNVPGAPFAALVRPRGFCRRDPDKQAGGGTGHGSGRAANQESAAPKGA